MNTLIFLLIHIKAPLSTPLNDQTNPYRIFTKENLEGQCQDVKHKAVLNSEKGDIPEHKGMPPLSSSSGL